MQISASFLSSTHIPKTLRLLNETDVDYIHVDIMDGKFVKGKTMPFREMKHLKEYTSKRLDVHLMVENPTKYIKNYAELNTEYVTIHYEIKEDLLPLLKQIKSYAIKAGLSIKPETEVKDIVPFLPYLDLILVMSVEPGKGGQDFLDTTISKVEEVKTLLKSYPDLSIKISVDGGINEAVAKKLKNKADVLVSGSYIINSDDYQTAISRLR